MTIIDTGPKTKEAIEALRAGLRKAGFLVSDLRRIVLTHAHEDHCGLARSLRDEAKNAEVFVHNWETGHRTAGSSTKSIVRCSMRAGVPEDEIEGCVGCTTRMRKYADSFGDDEYTALWDEAELEFESGSLRILHTPGHTPGSCSFLREADRTMIAGDCVLKRITPNPVLSPDPIDPSRRFPSLAEYLVSLARLRSFSPTLVYGGHGEPIHDYEELFNRYFRAFQERQAQVIGLVAKDRRDRLGRCARDVSRRRRRSPLSGGLGSRRPPRSGPHRRQDRLRTSRPARHVPAVVIKDQVQRSGAGFLHFLRLYPCSLAKFFGTDLREPACKAKTLPEDNLA